MSNLAHPPSQVTVIGKVLGNHTAVEELAVLLHGLATGLLIDTGPVRVKAREQGSAGGPANGTLAMRIGEEHAPLGQPVDMRRTGLRMTIHATDPVIKIVDGDQQGIRLGPQARVQKSEPDQKEGDALHVGKGKGVTYTKA